MEITNSRWNGILVDEVDFDLNESRWSIGTTGYARRGAIGAGGVRRAHKMHRIIGSRIVGRELLKSEEIDHINGNTRDNRRSNLRIATHRENLRNQQNRRRGQSGYVGVSRCRNHLNFRSYLVVDNSQVSAGNFDNLEEAAWMRDQWALALHGEFARLNFKYYEVSTQQNRELSRTDPVVKAGYPAKEVSSTNTNTEGEHEYVNR